MTDPNPANRAQLKIIATKQGTPALGMTGPVRPEKTVSTVEDLPEHLRAAIERRREGEAG